MTSVAMQSAIDTFLTAPIKKVSKEEAKKNLIACGILNKDGTIAECYKDIIVKKSE